MHITINVCVCVALHGDFLSLLFSANTHSPDSLYVFFNIDNVYFIIDRYMLIIVLCNSYRATHSVTPSHSFLLSSKSFLAR